MQMKTNLTVKDLIEILATLDPDALVVAHEGDDHNYAHVDENGVYVDHGVCYINGYGEAY